MRRYILISHSARLGMICVWDNLTRRALTGLNQALWVALKYEEMPMD